MPQRHRHDTTRIATMPRYTNPSPLDLRGTRRRKKKPAGVKGAPHMKVDSRQLPPEEMPAFQPGIIVATIADIPRDCKCVWVARIGSRVVWELKFTYAMCREKHALAF